MELLTPAVGSGGTVSCSIPTLSPQSVMFTIVTTVGGGVSNGTILTNTATVSSTTPDPHPGNGSATSNSTVSNTTAVVTITKTGAPDRVAAGANLSYTITTSNNGHVDLDTATLTDALPSGTTFVSLAAPGSWSCTTPAVGAAGSVTCSIMPMPATTVDTFTLIVKVASTTPPGPLTNQVSLFSSSGGRDTTLLASATVQVILSADVVVTNNDAPDPVTAGSNIVYSINVNNAGPSNASTVTLSDTLPAGTTFVSLAAPGGWSCSTPAIGAGGTVSCSIATLVGSSSTAFTLTVKTNIALPAGTISDTATASSSTPDPAPANNNATASASIILDIPALGGKELLGLAAILAAVAMLTTGRAVR